MKRKSKYLPSRLFTQIFSEKKTYLAFGKVAEEEIAKDGRSYSVLVNLMEENEQTLVRVGFPGDFFGQILIGDVVLIAFVGGNIDAGVTIAYLPSELRKLHPKHVMGETVVSSRKGKNINISNNHEAELTEPAVLGIQLQTWFHDVYVPEVNKAIKKLQDDLNELRETYNGHTHATTATTTATVGTGPPGTVIVNVPVPTQKQNPAFDTQTEQDNIKDKTTPENTDVWKSDLCYIQERGKNAE